MLLSQYRDKVEDLARAALEYGDKDMAALLRAYSIGKREEVRGDYEVLVDVAQQLRDEADNVACKLEQSADCYYGGWVSYSHAVRA